MTVLIPERGNAGLRGATYRRIVTGPDSPSSAQRRTRPPQRMSSESENVARIASTRGVTTLAPEAGRLPAPFLRTNVVCPCPTHPVHHGRVSLALNAPEGAWTRMREAQRGRANVLVPCFRASHDLQGT